MRVISGLYRGRLLKGDNLKGTRPTMDKIKESLFAMIQNSIKDSICLDLFAGSGSLGIEALSNGAEYVYFVDKSNDACQIIRDNFNNLGISNNYKLQCLDYKKALNYFVLNNIKFNLIFLDPPYQSNLYEEILLFINDNNLLLDNGKVICEYSSISLNDSYNNLISIKDRKYGDKLIKIYRYCENNKINI